MKLIPYGRQLIGEDDVNAVVDVLRSDFITQGVKIREFEAAIADYCNAKYAVTFSSGTAALHGAYFAAGIDCGDEIVTSPITFAATANAALFLGAKPVFVDIEPDTGNIDVQLIEKSITKATKAVVPVHFSGHPVDVDAIYNISSKYDLVVIEDACHALGARYKNRKIGSISGMTVFSFHPVKSITTGEGGAVLTDSREHYEKLSMFRTHGITKENLTQDPPGEWYYEMQLLGFNYRLTDIQAALGISQLNKLDIFIERRREIASRYNEEFRGNPYFEILAEREYAMSTSHHYPIRLNDKFKANKKEIFSKIREKGLGVQVHYIPVYLHPFYQKLGYKQGACKAAEDFYRREISIPIYPYMRDEDIEYVIEIIGQVFAEL